MRYNPRALNMLLSPQQDLTLASECLKAKLLTNLTTPLIKPHSQFHHQVVTSIKLHQLSQSQHQVHTNIQPPSQSQPQGPTSTSPQLPSQCQAPVPRWPLLLNSQYLHLAPISINQQCQQVQPPLLTKVQPSRHQHTNTSRRCLNLPQEGIITHPDKTRPPAYRNK